MKSSRLVLDTNVLVSAALFKQSKPAIVLKEVYRQEVLLISSEILEELQNVLKREKFDRYISEVDREIFVQVVVERSIFFEPQVKIDICRDPKDNHILELANFGKADFIITGDDDLLVLDSFQSIPIMTPDAWLQNFSTS
jgi:putative PIN family toxin of toxin-antitoxin system